MPKLYLIPAPLTESGGIPIAEAFLPEIYQLKHFIVERSKTSRAYIKSLKHPLPQSELEVMEMDKHKGHGMLPEMLEWFDQGKDIGVLSEAGCPGIADPGANVVRKAHDMNYEVIAIPGPSAIFLALMASGMNGQNFCFHGYLPVDEGERMAELKKIESDSKHFQRTMIWIETPYRNNRMAESCLKTLQASTRLCIAVDLTGPDQWVKSSKIAEWKKSDLPDMHKLPAVYCLLAP
jgi:16S rRNA (cytidine1402-2'-O)-methyltransferase